LIPREKIDSKIFYPHISVILNVSFHVLLSSLILNLNPCKEHSLFAFIYNI
jgi:hypothetical protein